MVNEKKICFIVCVNNNTLFQEMLYYINRLAVPEGIEIEVLEIRDAVSMAAGYNEGMMASDAKYKVYMHQDVLLTYHGFIQAILDVFAADAKIGMLGIVGSPVLPEDGIMWNGERVCGSYKTVSWQDYHYDLADDLGWEVEAVDGLLIATQCDIFWREDLFDGWDFYDISQAMEMHRYGYKVFVPDQRNVWYHHIGQIISFWNYNKYRKIFFKEYQLELKERMENYEGS